MNIRIQHQEEMRFVAHVDKHQVICDLPIPHGGTDQGMSLPQLFIAAIGSCIGVYVVDCCENIGIDPNNLTLDLDWVMAMDPKRIKRINIKLDLPEQPLNADQTAEIEKAVNACMLHTTLTIQPEINLDMNCREMLTA